MRATPSTSQAGEIDGKPGRDQDDEHGEPRQRSARVEYCGATQQRARQRSTVPMTTVARTMRGSRRRGVAIEPQPAAPHQDRCRAASRRPSRRSRSPPPRRHGRSGETEQATPIDGGRKPGERREHRRARVLVRERHRAEHLLERVAGQAGADRRERRGDRRGVARPEGAALEQRRRRSAPPARRRRPRTAAPGRARSRSRAIARRDRRAVVRAHARGDRRHQHRGDGDRDHAERQFVEAVGVVEPRHRGLRGRRHHGAGDQLQLRNAGSDQAGNGEHEEAPRVGGKVEAAA